MTRKENLEKCKGLLNSSMINYPLSHDDFTYLTTNIFPLHKRWKEKCNGKSVRNIIVHRHPDYHNKCFALVLGDSSIVDISFLECINRPGLQKDIKNICKTAISDLSENSTKDDKIIKEWIKTFENEELSVGKYIAEDNIDYIIDNFRKYYTKNV